MYLNKGQANAQAIDVNKKQSGQRQRHDDDACNRRWPQDEDEEENDVGMGPRMRMRRIHIDIKIYSIRMPWPQLELGNWKKLCKSADDGTGNERTAKRQKWISFYFQALPSAPCHLPLLCATYVWQCQRVWARLRRTLAGLWPSNCWCLCVRNYNNRNNNNNRGIQQHGWHATWRELLEWEPVHSESTHYLQDAVDLFTDKYYSRVWCLLNFSLCSGMGEFRPTVVCANRSVVYRWH